MRYLGEMLEGIGCLVLENGKTDGPQLGVFQTPGDISALMCVTAEMIDHIRALIEIGYSAAYRLLNPKPGEDDPRDRGGGIRTRDPLHPITVNRCFVTSTIIHVNF
jgi:hypothetical protein